MSDEQQKKIFSNNLLRLMSERNKTRNEVSSETGIKYATLCEWINRRKYPRIDKIQLLADYFHVKKSDLIEDKNGEECKDSFFDDPRILPIKKKKIPLLGGVACGEPVFHEEFESYVEVTTDIKADFALKAIGDSMINIGIKDGYIVFIRQQPAVDNGEVAAVNIDGEFTLKRVYNYGNILVLRAENPDFPDMEYREGDADNIVVLGKAVAFQGDVK